MAKPQSAETMVDSYTIPGTNVVIVAGDCVLMKPEKFGKDFYIGRVEQIMADNCDNNVKVKVRWFYRPEESTLGRMSFQGDKELLLYDHTDIQSVKTINGKCIVHTFEKYSKLDYEVGHEEYYWRLEYDSKKQAFGPEKLPVYCLCEMPHNPDELMVECKECFDWFHPECVNLEPGEAKQKHFVCSDHTFTKNEEKSIELANGNPSTSNNNLKRPSAFASKCKGKKMKCQKKC